MVPNSGLDVEVINSVAPNEKIWFPTGDDSSIPPPLNQLVDVNLSRRSVVYEVTLGRDLGIDIVQGPVGPVIGQVTVGSKAEQLGLRSGDIIVATSATAGDQMWTHESDESVKSALNTRFVMSPQVKMRLERTLESVPEDVAEMLRVPYVTTVQLKRPIGLHVVEGPGKTVFVQYIKPDLGASRSRRIEVGDQIVAMSASWGDKMWEVNSVESFVVGVKMRTDTQLSFQIKRMVPLEVYTGQVAGRQQRLLLKKEESIRKVAANTAPKEYSPMSASNMDDDMDEELMSGRSGEIPTRNKVNNDQNNLALGGSLIDYIDRISTTAELAELWNGFQKREIKGEKLTPFMANKLMTAALRLEIPDLAIDVFEDSFGFYCDPDPAKDMLNLFDPLFDEKEEKTVNMKWDTSAEFDKMIQEASGKKQTNKRSIEENPINSTMNLRKSVGTKETKLLMPNNFVCTTAVKAYGRKNLVNKALAIAPWAESKNINLDIYFLSSLLFVCAKTKKVNEAEKIFWEDIPQRGLNYTVATTNSLMYMYAKINRPDDALKVYELSKDMGLKCTVVTYGVLIKALMRSGKKELQETSFEILRSLPEMGIFPGTEVYNQFLEHYAKTHDFRQTKNVLRLMSQSKPRAKPDVVSYGYLISCFAESKKPRSALTVYHQMRKRRIAPNGYTYMGVLKALSHMRDGLSAVQVIGEMREKGVIPDRKHYAMAMFACVTSNQCGLAESVFAMYVRMGEKPDVALYTLFLRALLQQGKWQEGMLLFRRMLNGKEIAGRPNHHTLNCLLQYQVLDSRWSEALKTLDLVLLLQQPASDKQVSPIVTSEASPPTAVTPSGASPSGNAAPQSTAGASSTSVEFGELYTSARKIFIRNRKAMIVTANGNAPSLESTFTALSSGLGTYSTQLQRMQKEDIAYAPSAGEDYGRVVELPKPHPNGLHFLMDAAERIGSYKDSYFQVDFYLELLKACILEGQTVLAKKLLNMRANGQIRLRDDDDEKMKNIEDLARKALASSASNSISGNKRQK
eukprot:CAMPEP_0119036792 /NCGR_PEP_ID=MMETSP1177-20130426/4743_1 /TAXON_ID=2985 /ORGANISM="Ochromonas sp, Strain CCMP1899" /LENGTH=1022 /DNA_ID=CAMNT_0006997161 /DNA_START=227 /DNA_END=3295 /DNA_ORIENTATION=-